MLPRLAVVALVVVFGLSVRPHAGALQPADDVKVWLDAIAKHDPGTFDVHAETIGMWPWARLNPVLRALRDRLPVALGLRAAMLYLDLAVHVDMDRRPRYPTEGSVLQVEDGRVLGLSRLDSQIWWARRILVLGGDPPRDERAEDAVAWYRGTTAMLAADISLSDLEPHAYDAVMAYPDDAGILFDVGCVAETFASPRVRAAIPAAETGAASGWKRLPRSGVERTVPENLGEAERHFRRSVARDGSLMEPRVRLGRVLSLAGRLADAKRELDAAASMTGPPELRYLAHLFRGQALEDLRDLQEAEAAYDQAAALLPSAQSARLALSAVRLERGDPAGARAALRPVWSRRAGALSDPDDDPWWDYHRCAGRDFTSIYRDLAGRIGRLPRG